MLRRTSVVMTSTGASRLTNVVAGQQADVVPAVAADQIGVLLVGKGLERRGVEGLGPGGQGPGHCVLPHHRLA